MTKRRAGYKRSAIRRPDQGGGLYPQPRYDWRDALYQRNYFQGLIKEKDAPDDFPDLAPLAQAAAQLKGLDISDAPSLAATAVKIVYSVKLSEEMIGDIAITAQQFNKWISESMQATFGQLAGISPLQKAIKEKSDMVSKQIKDTIGRRKDWLEACGFYFDDRSIVFKGYNPLFADDEIFYKAAGAYVLLEEQGKRLSGAVRLTNNIGALPGDIGNELIKASFAFQDQVGKINRFQREWIGDQNRSYTVDTLYLRTIKEFLVRRSFELKTRDGFGETVGLLKYIADEIDVAAKATNDKDTALLILQALGIDAADDPDADFKPPAFEPGEAFVGNIVEGYRPISKEVMNNRGDRLVFGVSGVVLQLGADGKARWLNPPGIKQKPTEGVWDNYPDPAQAKAAYEKLLNKDGLTPPADLITPQPPQPLTCDHCKITFLDDRKDARRVAMILGIEPYKATASFCSGACLQAYQDKRGGEIKRLTEIEWDEDLDDDVIEISNFEKAMFDSLTEPGTEADQVREMIAQLRADPACCYAGESRIAKDCTTKTAAGLILIFDDPQGGRIVRRVCGTDHAARYLMQKASGIYQVTAVILAFVPKLGFRKRYLVKPGARFGSFEFIQITADLQAGIEAREYIYRFAPATMPVRFIDQNVSKSKGAKISEPPPVVDRRHRPTRIVAKSDQAKAPIRGGDRRIGDIID